MSGALDPIQEDLPLDLPGSSEAPRPAPGQPPAPGWRQPLTPPGPSLYEQVWTRVRGLPWARWRAQATPVIQTGAVKLRIAARLGANQAGTLVQAAITRGGPYTLELARATARTRLVPAAASWLARGIHVVGLPAVVLRSALQVLIIHRAGLAIEEAVFFRLDDPAAYTVYEAPAQFGLAVTIAFVPTLVLVFLGVLCLAPALAPRAILHLPTTWLTAVEIWLGLAFGAHALPIYEEAGPLGEQARVAVSRSHPGALLLIVPCYVTAWVTRLGGLLPALLGGAAVWWLAGTVLRG
ncbi:MAG TPA: hypothetical protein VET65_03465 [Candidatus Limnocylindrales bacterium]|nr:hypothetical protein [Candidatus Limnocylindrales bacterium]